MTVEKYMLLLSVPIEATDQRAAIAAQLAMFNQIKVFLSRGIRDSEYVIPPLNDAEFPMRGQVVLLADLLNRHTPDHPAGGG